MTTTADVAVTGVDKTLVGTVTRGDGSNQVTIAGWPVYRYVKDTAPGEVKGQGAGGNWFAVTPEGKKASGEPANAVSLVVMKVGDLGDIVTDREGMTLYRFNEDTAKPSKSNCDGGCATQWPPVIASSGEVQVDGVDAALVGTVERSDGSLQVTIAGWPVYRFAGDKVPCDTNGHGVGGTWFAITPQGKPAGA
jgi:predicted lipoprotein with Yx(FWY)xxD motif